MFDIESVRGVDKPVSIITDMEEDSLSLPPVEMHITGSIAHVAAEQLLDLLRQIDESVDGFDGTPTCETVDNGDGTYTHTFRFNRRYT